MSMNRWCLLFPVLFPVLSSHLTPFKSFIFLYFGTLLFLRNWLSHKRAKSDFFSETAKFSLTKMIRSKGVSNGKGEEKMKGSKKWYWNTQDIGVLTCLSSFLCCFCPSRDCKKEFPLPWLRVEKIYILKSIGEGNVSKGSFLDLLESMLSASPVGRLDDRRVQSRVEGEAFKSTFHSLFSCILRRRSHTESILHSMRCIPVEDDEMSGVPLHIPLECSSSIDGSRLVIKENKQNLLHASLSKKDSSLHQFIHQNYCIDSWLSTRLTYRFDSKSPVQFESIWGRERRL